MQRWQGPIQTRIGQNRFRREIITTRAITSLTIKCAICLVMMNHVHSTAFNNPIELAKHKKQPVISTNRNSRQLTEEIDDIETKNDYYYDKSKQVQRDVKDNKATKSYVPVILPVDLDDYPTDPSSFPRFDPNAQMKKTGPKANRGKKVATSSFVPGKFYHSIETDKAEDPSSISQFPTNKPTSRPTVSVTQPTENPSELSTVTTNELPTVGPKEIVNESSFEQPTDRPTGQPTQSRSRNPVAETKKPQSPRPSVYEIETKISPTAGPSSALETMRPSSAPLSLFTELTGLPVLSSSALPSNDSTNLSTQNNISDHGQDTITINTTNPILSSPTGSPVQALQTHAFMMAIQLRGVQVLTGSSIFLWQTITNEHISANVLSKHGTEMSDLSVQTEIRSQDVFGERRDEPSSDIAQDEYLNALWSYNGEHELNEAPDNDSENVIVDQANNVFTTTHPENRKLHLRTDPSAEVALPSLVRSRHLQVSGDNLHISFLVVFEFRSSSYEHDVKQYAANAFDTIEEQNDYVEALKNTYDQSFLNLESATTDMTNYDDRSQAPEPILLQSTVSAHSTSEKWLISGLILASVCSVAVGVGVMFASTKKRQFQPVKTSIDVLPNKLTNQGQEFVIPEIKMSNLGDPNVNCESLLKIGDCQTGSDGAFNVLLGTACDLSSVSSRSSKCPEVENPVAVPLESQNDSCVHPEFPINTSRTVDSSFQADVTEHIEIVEVIAPPGMLGIVVESPGGYGPVVHGVKESSVLSGKVQIGDKLIALDGEDTTTISASRASKLISYKSSKPTRVLLFQRRCVNSPTKVCCPEIS